MPLQRSSTSQGPAADRQRVPAGFTVLVEGQDFPTPSHVSGTSQSPCVERHSTVFGITASVGHASLDPSQYSATSQTPDVARQNVDRVYFASLGQTKE